MAKYGTMHMYTHEQVEITCEHQLNERRPEGYPVLAIGTLTIYPTRERLERLRDVIDAYLAAHGNRADGSSDRYACGCGMKMVELDDCFRCMWCGHSISKSPPISPPEIDGPAESLESMRLEELKSDLTEAAHEVGIDPDGLTDGEVIRALVDRGKGGGA